MEGNAMDRYDYIVVGGGSAGCCVAARLAEDPAISVLLIEAGPKKGGLAVDMPAMLINVVPPNPKNWSYWTAPQEKLGDRSLYWPRGKVLGGSSAINGMLYIRGHHRDYDEWAQLGCKGWSYSDVLPYFIKAQNSDREDEFHGTSGPLKTTRDDSRNPLNHAFLKAGQELGLPFTDDFNGTSQEGVGWYDRTISGGRRQSTARAYLSHIDQQPNLHIIDQAQVTGVILEGKTAIGVTYYRRGEKHSVHAQKEVILSGGAVNSPQLLQLSGIGDPDDLYNAGIEVKHALPGVGKNLQDHLDALVSAKLNQPLSFKRYETPHRGLFEMAKWFLGAHSALGESLLPVGAFAKTDQALERPDVQLHIVLGHGEKPHGMAPAKDHGFGIHVCQLRPHSRGSIKIVTPDPLAPPDIDPAYLSAEEDLAVLRRGVALTLQFMRHPAMAHYIEEEHAPWLGMNIEDHMMMDDAIKGIAETIYHPVGTCSMGPAEHPASVVDPRLKVIGVDGLRVVDASVMPRLIGGNTNAPTIMIAEKAADMIKEDQAIPIPA